MNRAADHLSVCFLYDFLLHNSLVVVYVYFLQLLPRLITLEFQVIALEFLIKQILQPAGTPPFLLLQKKRSLVASPVRHAELEHEDH